jgi:hypothetical protein
MVKRQNIENLQKVVAEILSKHNREGHVDHMAIERLKKAWV